VSAREESDEHALEQDFLADNDASRFEQGLFKALSRQFWLDESVGIHFELVHVCLPPLSMARFRARRYTMAQEGFIASKPAPRKGKGCYGMTTQSWLAANKRDESERGRRWTLAQSPVRAEPVEAWTGGATMVEERAHPSTVRQAHGQGERCFGDFRSSLSKGKSQIAVFHRCGTWDSIDR